MPRLSGAKPVPAAPFEPPAAASTGPLARPELRREPPPRPELPLAASVVPMLPAPVLVASGTLPLSALAFETPAVAPPAAALLPVDTVPLTAAPAARASVPPAPAPATLVVRPLFPPSPPRRSSIASMSWPLRSRPTPVMPSDCASRCSSGSSMGGKAPPGLRPAAERPAMLPLLPPPSAPDPPAPSSAFGKERTAPDWRPEAPADSGAPEAALPAAGAACSFSGSPEGARSGLAENRSMVSLTRGPSQVQAYTANAALGCPLSRITRCPGHAKRHDRLSCSLPSRAFRMWLIPRSQSDARHPGRYRRQSGAAPRGRWGKRPPAATSCDAVAGCSASRTETGPREPDEHPSPWRGIWCST